MADTESYRTLGLTKQPERIKIRLEKKCGTVNQISRG